jgi:myo-inositol-1(or 4)-monophosphatase
MNRRDFCIESVRAAGSELLTLAKRERIVEVKGGDPKDIVTDADLVIGKMLTDAIATTFPGESIYSEEAPTTTGNGIQWVIDPIDGTANFSRGIPHYAVCLGVLDGGVPIAGAVFNPMTNELFSFEKGGGAFLNGERIHVSTRTELSKASVLLRAGRKPEFAVWGGEAYTKLLTNAWKTGGLGSASLDTCFVAAGRVEASIYGQFRALDSAPALGILAEAGGMSITKDGTPIGYSAPPQTVIAANTTKIADAVRELLF